MLWAAPSITSTCRPCERLCAARSPTITASNRSSSELFQAMLSVNGKSQLEETNMFLTRKHLSRRALLKGAGASIALPLLDAMIPAGTAFAQTAAKPSRRLGFVYFPHGALQNEWQPKQVGKNPEFPYIL